MDAPVPVIPRVLHLSLIVGSDLIDGTGRKLGRVDDLIVRLGDDEYPPVSGILATVAGRQVFVPAEAAVEIEHGRATLAVAQLDLQPFERRSQEVLLKKDVLDRQLINIDGARLVRANEIEITRLEGWYRVVGVDVRMRGIARRLVPQGALPARSGRASSSTGRASSRSPDTCPPFDCAFRIRSWRGFIRPSSPTSSRRRRTTRARRSSTPSARTRARRPTCSRS